MKDNVTKITEVIFLSNQRNGRELYKTIFDGIKGDYDSQTPTSTSNFILVLMTNIYLLKIKIELNI